MNKQYFEVALIEKPGCEGLTKSEVMDLHDMLSRPEAFPIEIGDVNGNSSAMGFITPQAAEELQYEYGQDSELGQFISSILNDVDKESEDGTYIFKELRIWMNREQKQTEVEKTDSRPDWIKSDDLQWVKVEAHNCEGEPMFDMIEVRAAGGDEYHVVRGTVDIEECPIDSLDSIIQGYGYPSIKDIRDNYPDDYAQVIAECIFECTPEDELIVFGPFSSEDEAEAYAESLIW